jgi:hypothetical protein
MGRTKGGFWGRVEKTPGCWLWKGTILYTGYGQRSLGGGVAKLAHRLAYELSVGPIPRGMKLDHTCHNQDKTCPGGWSCAHRRCVNPAHLEVVTQRENVLRGFGIAARNVQKTHCKHGHEFTEENTYKTIVRGNPKRECWTCKRSNRMKYKLNPALA